MPEILNHYTTYDIAAVIDKTIPFVPYFLGAYGRVYNTDKQTIHFEEIPDDRRISPFVSPLVKGKVARQRGANISVFAPGYIKDKETIDPQGHFTRVVGEPVNGSLTPGQRLQAAMVARGNAIQRRFLRRMEVMASQLTINGKYTMEGEDFPAVEVDFQRDAGLTQTLAGAARWGQAGVSPLETIDTFVDSLEFPVARITMGGGAAAWFKKDPDYRELIKVDYNQLGGPATLVMGPQQENRQKVTYIGSLPTLGNVGIYVNNDTYQDNDGTTKRYVGTDQVVFESSASYGWRCFAGIQDLFADLRTLDQFWRAWTETGDPAAHYLMMQSAPMLATTSVNSTGVINTQG